MAKPLLTDTEFQAWHQVLATNSPRHSGDSNHVQMIAWLRCMCLKHAAAQTVYPQIFVRRDFGSSSLEYANKSFRVASHLPCSALGQVKAEVVVRRRLWWWPGAYRFKKKQHEGKVVALRVRHGYLKAALLLLVDPWSWKDAKKTLGRYRRPVSLEGQAPCLLAAEEKGVRGVVVVLDMPQVLAQSLYVPFTRPLGKVPAIYLDAAEGKAFIDAVKHEPNEKATLQVPGSQTCAETHHLVATIEGVNQDECVLINTHTDGPNVVEDNGVLGLYALLRHYATSPKPKCTLLFVFVTGHFLQAVGSTDHFIENNLGLLAHIKAAVTIEHLGNKRWEVDDEHGYHDTGKIEPALFFVSDHAWLRKVVKEVLAELNSVFLMRAVGFKFGEGVALAKKGVPTAGYLTNPNYLLNTAAGSGDHLNKICYDRMLAELEMFRKLIDRLIEA